MRAPCWTCSWNGWATMPWRSGSWSRTPPRCSASRTDGREKEERMKIGRRAALAGLALPFLAGRAGAQSFPDQPVRMIVPFAAGGPADIIARLVGRVMGERLGRPIVVDARAGAGGLIGVEAAAKARPDGHTIVLASSGAMVIQPHLQPSMPYDPLRDLAPITQVLGVPQIVSVAPNLGVKTLGELVAMAKARPGQLSFGSAGV